MYLKLTEDHLTSCPECGHLCLKIVCQSCNEEMTATISDEVFHELAAFNDPCEDTAPADTRSISPQAGLTVADYVNRQDDVQDLELEEISNKSH